MSNRTASEALLNPYFNKKEEDTVLGAEATLDDLTLRGTEDTAKINSVITAASIDRTIEGASTLSISVRDSKRELLSSGIFNQELTCEVDGLKFALVQIRKSGMDLELVFEDYEVSRLRKQTKPKRAVRGKVTRAQFAKSLVKEIKSPKIKFVSPELNVIQPIGSSGDRPSKQKQEKERQSGFARNVKFNVKGVRANRTQIEMAERILIVGLSLKVSRKILVCSMMTAITESELKNVPAGKGDRDSVGLFQQRPSQGWGPANKLADPEYAARKFFDAIIPEAKANPSMALHTLCQRVQRSGFPDGSNYKAYRSEAEEIVRKFGAKEDFGTADNKKLAKFVFSRGEPGGSRGEDSWTALVRLAEEVDWRAFMNQGTLHFISEESLFKSKPRDAISEDTPGVNNIDFSYDVGRPVADMTINCRASRWAAPPGTIVEIEDCGPADGRWLVVQITRSLFSPETTISLRKPVEKLAEPQAETADTGASGSEQADSGLPEAIQKAYAKAQYIHKKRYPYVFGGGHGSKPGPTGGGYDCSGAVSAVLAAAGALSRPQATGALSTFGVAGKGKYLTVWVKNVSDPKESHTFIEFEVPKKNGGKGKIEHFGTGDWGKGWSGAGFNPKKHTRSGFVARHIEGL